MRNWIWGIVSTLLLLVVAAHAMAPVPQAHGQGRGSAFSASTAEVSLKSGSQAIIAKQIVRLEPRGPAPVLRGLVVESDEQPSQRALTYVQNIVSLLGATTLGPIKPRAPPTA